MKIAIMGAMQEEIAPLLAYFKEYKTVEFAKNNYFPGTIFYANILITQDDTTNYGQ